jgi:hypothetical protein
MGIFDRFGARSRGPTEIRDAEVIPSEDDQAIARYRYMLKTAPPETIEQAHAEAFAKLTPEQRRKVLRQLAAELPDAERAAVERAGNDPATLARVATRAEVRQPGTLERTFGSLGPGAGFGGFGGLMAGSFLSSMAGTVLGSMIAQHFFSHPDLAHLAGGDLLHGDAHANDLHHGDADHPAHGALDDSLSSGGDDLGGDIDLGGGFDLGGDSFDV